MNVAIYDTQHFETTYTLARALDDGTKQLAIFTTADIAGILKSMPGMQSAAINWRILRAGSKDHPLRLLEHCKKNEVHYLFLNTVSAHHLFFGQLCLLLKKTKTILTVHDANSFFKPALDITPRGVLRHSGKKLLRQSVDGFYTLLGNTQRYIQKEFKVAKPVFSIPGSFFDEQIAPEDSANRISIVIPGSVDTKRRDYNQLFQLMSLLQSQELDLVLLGAAKDEEGRNIVRKCKDFSSGRMQVKVYESEFVPQQEYDLQLRKCHFVYAPLQRQFREESAIPEQYGLTKSSGCFFDAIRFAKPILLNAAIHLPDEIKGQAIVHHSPEELAGFLKDLDTAKLSKLLDAARQNSSQFSLDAIRKKLKASVLSF